MTATPLRIERLDAATPEKLLHAALTLVLRRLPEPTAEALRWSTVSQARGGWQPGRLWTARVADDLVGATWAQLQAGNVAQLWPAQWLAGRRPTGCDLLLDALLGDLQRQGCSCAQTLLPSAADDDAAPLREAGFAHVADLAYLAADATAGPDDGLPDALTFAKFTETRRARFAEIVERSYEGTLDCPQLNGIRNTTDVLDEYAAIGDAGTALWSLALHVDREVGCLLLADHAAQNQVELVYMAVLPDARGRGWGARLVRESLRVAAALGRARVVLAVDACNRPAAVHYRAAGFREWERRAAFVKRLGDSGSDFSTCGNS